MKLPVLVTVIGTACSAPLTASVAICGWYVAPNVLVQHTVAGVLPVGTPLPLNQVTPSCTRSKRRLYVPAFGGDWTWAWSATVWPLRRSAGSLVRSPSQATVVPVWSYQW